MGDVTEIDKHRHHDAELTDEGDSDTIRCSHCGDTLFFVTVVPEYTEVDEGGPHALICQHCYMPLGAAYVFDDEYLEET